MKNVLFIMKYIIDAKKDNLYTKFTGQMNAVEKLGYNVWYTGCTEDEIYICNKVKKIKIINIPKREKKFIKQIEFYKLLYKAVSNFLKENDIAFEFTYIRSMFFCVNSVILLKKLRKKNTKVIMEIPTYPVRNELKQYRNLFMRYLLLTIYEMSRWHTRYVDLFTVIGEDCKNEYFGKKAINIENGIDVENIPARIPSSRENEIHILTLATMAKWHGYDRLIKGLYDYYENNGKEKIFIHMVGNDGDGSLVEWKRLTGELNLNDYIIFEGYMTGEKLNCIINKCDIAVSSLAGYRINILSTAEMKSREYMARGIPFVYATNDKTLREAPDYCYKVKNDSSNIHINSIIEFARLSRKNKEIVDSMREYAFINMSWGKQFSKILEEIGGDRQ